MRQESFSFTPGRVTGIIATWSRYIKGDAYRLLLSMFLPWHWEYVNRLLETSSKEQKAKRFSFKSEVLHQTECLITLQSILKPEEKFGRTDISFRDVGS